MRIGVIGAGTMGSGIAQVAAFAGHEVCLYDLEAGALEKALGAIEKSLEKIVGKRELAPETVPRALGRLTTSTDRHSLSEVDFAIEAVFENFEVKREVFQWLDQVCPSSAILASNTSSISITRLGASTQRASQVIGMHFMNPVPLMKLVEVIRGLATSDQTFAATKALAEGLEKAPVEVLDYPGFVSNRVLMPMLNEAMFAVMEGVARPEDVDQVMKLGMNHPMGPLQLADFIGLDVCLDILNVLHDGFGDPKYRPCPLLRRMVDSGRLGRKSGRGFYEYG